MRAVRKVLSNKIKAGAVGGVFDAHRGDVVVVTSGKFLGTPTPIMQAIADEVGGLHQKTLCNNPVGACVEFKGADMLRRQNSAISDIRFVKVYRPEKGVLLEPCPHCRKMLEHFDSGPVNVQWNIDPPWIPVWEALEGEF